MFISLHLALQILMSVHLALVDVSMSVTTMMVAIPVNAIVDISLILINTTVQVQLHIMCAYTVKPAYNDHSRDQVIVVFVDRCMVLYRSALVQLRWKMSQPNVVSTGRWSLRQV